MIQQTFGASSDEHATSTVQRDVWVSWWYQYIDQNPRKDRPNGDPAVRASLRRCHTWSDAMSVAAAHDLARRVGADPAESEYRVIQVFSVARVLAHVTAHRAERLMDRAGAPADGVRGDDKNPIVSSARFRRLMSSEPGDELADQIIRVLAQLKGECNVAALAKDLMYWNDRTRLHWSFQYFGKTTGQRTDAIDFSTHFQSE
jgi:CRISPR system Cascade subunit CasB